MLVTAVDKISEEELLPGSESHFRTWRFPQCTFLVECSSALLEQINREVEESRTSPRGERETGGVLFGVHGPDGIRILVGRPLRCEHAMGPGFVLSEEDEKRLERLISAPATDIELRGLEALGWYHSHIRSRIFLSARDRQIHTRYFPAAYQVALVVHPSSEAPGRAGFFFREQSGAMRTESSYEEFTIEVPSPGRATRTKIQSPAGAIPKQEPQEPSAPQAHRPSVCPTCGSKHLKRSHRLDTFERLRSLFGYYPYRCKECLSRSFLKSSKLLRSTPTPRKRPEERRRARLRTRREILLWGGGILGFFVILRYLLREPTPKSDQP